MDVAHHCAATATTTTAANGPFLLHGCSHSNKYQYQHRETELRVLKLNDDGRKATQKEWTKQRVRLLFFCYSQCYRCCWCCCCLPLFFAIFVWFAIRACTLLFRSDSYTLAMPCNAICWCFSVDVVCASWCYLNFSFVSWIYYCFCLLSMLQCIGQCQPLEFSGECECIRDVFFFICIYISKNRCATAENLILQSAPLWSLLTFLSLCSTRCINNNRICYSSFHSCFHFAPFLFTTMIHELDHTLIAGLYALQCHCMENAILESEGTIFMEFIWEWS